MTSQFLIFGKNYHNESIRFSYPRMEVSVLHGGDYTLPPNSYGIVCEGSACLFRHSTKYEMNIRAKHWFCADNQQDLYLYAGYKTLLIDMLDPCPVPHKPFATGAVSIKGALGYIDGATNTLLYAPIKKGMPCMNCLHIDTPINQTPHTHPSPRIGYVITGQVIVKIWDKQGEQAQVIESYVLDAGDIWAMDKDVVHSFHTTNINPVRIFAFHPDSDFGPTDEVAPMINRTLVRGKSASDMPEIHTEK